MNICPHIMAKGPPESMSLYKHLFLVNRVAERFAQCLGFDVKIATLGAFFHDIGKAHPVFQYRLVHRPKSGEPSFRHEIASCFFLPLAGENCHPAIIEMIIAHHKSIENDNKGKGILDLEENEDGVLEFHLGDWELWKNDALEILAGLGVKTRDISRKEAEKSYDKVIEYCEKRVADNGYSPWRGLMMAADHFASALSDAALTYLPRTFKAPALGFYDRRSPLYPLSLKSASSLKPHTLVTACTGSGKTDFLFRRCRGRVFYTLPFQASINAMYDRVKSDLRHENPNLDIRLLHAASKITKDAESNEDILLQRLMGSSVKVLTPYQLTSIIFGTRGFESLVEDLKDCDVILDEIHTYNDVSKAIVLKLIEVLKFIGCRIHVGTATMPTVLYERIVLLLGRDSVAEISLDLAEMDAFDRHVIHKLNSWDDAFGVIEENVRTGRKILLICNRVDAAQDLYERVTNAFPDIPSLLIHSRFKRGDRREKESSLIGVNEKGTATGEFNTSAEACIVVSTQVVEVSLDISFDFMITEAAPIDSLIQRFGRINRKRTPETIGKYKPVYVLAPPSDQKSARPYDLEILKRSFHILPHGRVLHESGCREKIDYVYPELSLQSIENHTVYKGNGRWSIPILTHRKEAVLVELLDVDSVSCIVDSDCEAYEQASHQQRMMMEIPARFYAVKHYPQLACGAAPFIIPDSGYCSERGLDLKKANAAQADLNFI